MLGGLIYHAYYALHGRRPPDPAALVLARPGWLPAGGRALDLGGGRGRWARRLAARAGLVVVADLDQGSLARVAPHPGVRPVRVAGRAVPLADGSVDLVFIHHVLHHVEGLPAVLDEVRRVTRPGGVVVCVELDPASRLTRLFGWLSRRHGHACTFYPPEALAALLGAPPFAADWRRLDSFQYVVAARRRDAS